MLTERLAGAPISWGVCEVPGWGYQLEPERVLREMRELGLRATELGPDGFLPADPAQAAAALAAEGLACAGGFVPVVLHDPAHDPLPGLDRSIDQLLAAGAATVVLAAATGADGYDARPDLDADGWALLLRRLDELTDHAQARGLQAVLHPHVGTMVERGDEVERVLDGSRTALCLDTGHLLVGGTDPLDVVRSHAARVAHVHLKDVDAAVAQRVRAGELGYAEAVAQGLYRPLGQGDVDVAGIVRLLEGSGYQGWYVMEQDTVLDGPPSGEGPLADVRAGVEHLRRLA
ncbi:TIM barrel protein [Angustibacter aerolatus]